ncbi:lipoprotein, YaeC family [Peptoanaerobacter stomatis]|jgi:lipoprotein, yaeC family|uniref:Lipoprotein n=1 Tax=Peptoanaerobacter stomatis TaxID=796937 RepID=J4WHP6_9FIRM|nr:MetQ/NlpA family ABC transporter substrate-binding protein [Peptoanaerobacter stomatis]EJU24626.1 lipoprotein, YaeC family [Peptoanaerobacter stomatis]
MKKNIKKLLAFALSASILLVGCSSGGNEKQGTAKEENKTAPEEQVLKIGATPEPHAAILESVKPALEKEGIKLDIQVFNDYVIPNTALEEKDLDANYFQHQPYLDEFNAQKGTHIVSAGTVHVEPMAVYSKKYTALSDLPEGATISLPNDPTNGGRALILLQKEGLIKLKDGAGLTATDKDVVENAKNFKFELLDAAQLPRTLDDVDASVINTNYALDAKLDPTKDALVVEDKESPYANIVAVREGETEDPRIQALMKALNSEETKKFIEETYKGAIVPAF